MKRDKAKSYADVNPYDLVEVGKMIKLKRLRRRLRGFSDDPYSTFASYDGSRKE